MIKNIQKRVKKLEGRLNTFHVPEKVDEEKKEEGKNEIKSSDNDVIMQKITIDNKIEMLEKKANENNKAIKDIYDKLAQIPTDNLQDISIANNKIPEKINESNQPIDETQDISKMNEKILEIENKLKELTNNIDLAKIEETIKNLSNELNKKTSIEQFNNENERVNELKQNAQELNYHVKTINENVSKMKAQEDLCMSKLALLGKSITDFQTKMETNLYKIKEKVDLDNFENARISEVEWNELRNTVFQLNKAVPEIVKEIEELKELKKLYNDLTILLENKLNISDFEAWKNENDIQLMFSEFSAQFVENNEFKKKFEKLRKRIARIEGLIDQEEAKGIDSEKVLLANKRLGGWSCASCTKNLINLSGTKDSYYAWAKLPNNPKAPKLGYSRILSLAEPSEIFKTSRNAIVRNPIPNYESVSENEEDNIHDQSSSLPNINVKVTKANN